MKKQAEFTPAEAEIVAALSVFLGAVQEGTVKDRFTVRTVSRNLQPRIYTSDDARRTRELLGLSQTLFAHFLGVSVKLIRACEQGQHELSGMVDRFLDEVVTNPEYWQARIRDLMGPREDSRPDHLDSSI